MENKNYISWKDVKKKLEISPEQAEEIKLEQEIIEAISIFQPEYVISFGRKPVINRIYIEPAACNECDCIRTNFDISALATISSPLDKFV